MRIMTRMTYAAVVQHRPSWRWTHKIKFELADSAYLMGFGLFVDV